MALVLSRLAVSRHVDGNLDVGCRCRTNRPHHCSEPSRRLLSLPPVRSLLHGRGKLTPPFGSIMATCSSSY